jgi:hypothetical protein
VIDLTDHLGTIRATARDWFRRVPSARWHMDIEDAEQSAYLIACDADRAFDGDRGGYAAWLVRKIRWGLSEWLSSLYAISRRHRLSAVRRSIVAPTERTPFDREQDCERVRRATASVDPWMLRKLSGDVSRRQITEATGWSRGQYEWRVKSAKDRIAINTQEAA